MGTQALTKSNGALKTLGNLKLQALAVNIPRGAEHILTSSLTASQQFLGLKELCLDLSETSGRLLRLDTLMTAGNLPGLEKLRILASEKNQINDTFMAALFDDSRKTLRHVDLQNCGEVSDDLFGSWFSTNFDPEQEAIDYVDFLIDRQLIRRSFQAGSAAAVSSDSDATVLHRPGRLKRRTRGKSFGVGTTSGSDAEGAFGGGFGRLRFPAGPNFALTPQGVAVQRLTVLCLGGATNLTDKSVMALSRLLPWVQTLELRDCGSVSEETVEDFRRHARCLRRLFLSTPKLRIRLDTSRSFTRKTRRHAPSIISSEDD
jgi:hypothetical protein